MLVPATRTTCGRVVPAVSCSVWGTVMTGSTYEEKRQIFERNFLLGKLSPSEIDALLTYSRVERYPAGEEIFAKGSPGNSLMIVLRGRVRISSISLAGKEIVLNIIDAGEIVGEIATLDGGERSGDAVAMSDCELLVLNRRDFMPFLENHADICLMLIKILCQRLRHTSEQVEDLQFPSSRRADRQSAAAALATYRAAGGRRAAPRIAPVAERTRQHRQLLPRERQQAAAGVAKSRLYRPRQGLDRDPRPRRTRAADLIAPPLRRLRPTRPRRAVFAPAPAPHIRGDLRPPSPGS